MELGQSFSPTAETNRKNPQERDKDQQWQFHASFSDSQQPLHQFSSSVSSQNFPINENGINSSDTKDDLIFWQPSIERNHSTYDRGEDDSLNNIVSEIELNSHSIMDEEIIEKEDLYYEQMLEKASENRDKITGPRPVKWRGMLSVLGGTLSHAILGSMYCWNHFISYLPRNMLFFSLTPESWQSSSPDAYVVLPMTMLFICITMPAASILYEKIGLRKSMVFGGFIMSTGVYFASLTKSLEAFLCCYCILFGSGVGLVYTASIVAAWKWFPNRKGLVTGSIFFGVGLGNLVFNLVGTAIANPNHYNVDENGEFPEEVYDNFSHMLKVLSVIYMFSHILSSLLVCNPCVEKPSLSTFADRSLATTKSNKKENRKKKELTVMEALRTGTFWKLWFCIFLSVSAGMNTISVYSTFGGSANKKLTDSYLSSIGVFGNVVNGLGRPFWGILQDRLGTKTPFVSLVLAQTIIMVFYSHLVSYRLVYALATHTVFFCLGGNFVLAPGACGQLFGIISGPKIFAALWSAFALAAIVGSSINRVLSSFLGYTAVFDLMGILSLVSGGLIMSIDEI